jgi:hypothetical protein
MAARPSLTWEAALAQCEATLAEAETLLHARPELPIDPATAIARSGIDLWQSNLPPLPAELLARARAVHNRQLRLQAELAAAMTVIDHHRQLSSDGVQTRPTAQYLDCSA